MFSKVSNQTSDSEPYYRICRICFDSDPINMIIPCLCSGTSQYAHEECMKSWISIKFPGLNSASCEICGKKLVLEIKKSWKCKQTDDEDAKCLSLCKIFIILIALSFLLIFLIAVLTFYVDFKNKIATSIVLILSCAIPIIVCIYFLTKTILKLYLASEINYFQIKPVQ